MFHFFLNEKLGLKMAQIRYNVKYKLGMKTKLSNKTKKELHFSEDCAFWEIKKGIFYLFIFLNLKHTNHQILTIPPKGSSRIMLYVRPHTILKHF